MDIDLSLLTENVGLKFNGTVILGREKVSKFIEENQNEFQDLDLSRLDDSHMLYGYNSSNNPIKIGFDKEGISRIVILSDFKNQFKRFKCAIAYDGHMYNGFQIQDNQPTIQGILTDIVSEVNGYETLIQGCSRTDAGVHANDFIIHFDSIYDIDADRWKQLLNYRIPKDIQIKWVEETHPLFHSRYDAYKKRYIYKIKLGESDPFKVNYEWAVENIDVESIKKNLKQLVGTHDFSSFCKGQPGDKVRTLMKADLKQNKDELTLIFEGDGFLRHMVRLIVYSVIEIARGKLGLGIEELLAEKSRIHTKHMAPASGLYLDEITY